VSDIPRLRKAPERIDEADEPRLLSGATSHREVLERLLWDIGSINADLDEIQRYWAKSLGISGPQWMILMALSDLDKGQGIPVKDVASRLRVDPSFVTTQSRLLEKDGLMRRIASKDDARVVLLSLSPKAYRQISGLSGKQNSLNEFIFAGFDFREIKDILEQLALLRRRLAKANVKLSADL
jgi:MarR family transcriptional regulator, organic hydroperoxide resistance regulator